MDPKRRKTDGGKGMEYPQSSLLPPKVLTRLEQERITYLNTPLHVAVRDDDFTQTEELLNMGVDINAKNYENATPLHFAVRHSDTSKIMNLLLSRGAAVDAVDDKGESPLHHAVRYGVKSHLKALLSSGANVNATCFKGNTPLMHAALTNNLNLAFFLLEHGANVFFANSLMKNTALHLASYHNQRMVNLLLLYKADITIKNHWGETPLEHSTVRECVTALIVIGVLNGDCPDEEFRRSCLEEWEKIKETRTLNLLVELRNKKYFLSDMTMMTRLHDLTRCMSTLEVQFPIYAQTLEWMFKMACRRNHLLNTAFKTLFNDVFIHLSVCLPEELVQRILEYLDDADLSTLCQLDKWNLLEAQFDSQQPTPSHSVPKTPPISSQSMLLSPRPPAHASPECQASNTAATPTASDYSHRPPRSLSVSSSGSPSQSPANPHHSQNHPPSISSQSTPLSPRPPAHASPECRSSNTAATPTASDYSHRPPRSLSVSSSGSPSQSPVNPHHSQNHPDLAVLIQGLSQQVTQLSAAQAEHTATQAHDFQALRDEVRQEMHALREASQKGSHHGTPRSQASKRSRSPSPDGSAGLSTPSNRPQLVQLPAAQDQAIHVQLPHYMDPHDIASQRNDPPAHHQPPQQRQGHQYIPPHPPVAVQYPQQPQQHTRHPPPRINTLEYLQPNYFNPYGHRYPEADPHFDWLRVLPTPTTNFPFTTEGHVQQLATALHAKLDSLQGRDYYDVATALAFVSSWPDLSPERQQFAWQRLHLLALAVFRGWDHAIQASAQSVEPMFATASPYHQLQPATVPAYQVDPKSSHLCRDSSRTHRGGLGEQTMRGMLIPKPKDTSL